MASPQANETQELEPNVDDNNTVARTPDNATAVGETPDKATAVGETPDKATAVGETPDKATAVVDVKSAANKAKAGEVPTHDTKHGKDDSKHGKDDSKHGKDDSKHGKDDTKHGKDDSKHGKDDSKHGKDDTKHGKYDDKSDQQPIAKKPTQNFSSSKVFKPAGHGEEQATRNKGNTKARLKRDSGSGPDSGAEQSSKRSDRGSDHVKPVTKVVKLNVGGVTHYTTTTTLLRYAGSYFKTLIDSPHENVLRDESDCICIDRDGDLFTYILNYLRCNQLYLPAGFQMLDQLLAEARFYKLRPLVKELSDIKGDRSGLSHAGGLFLEVIERNKGSQNGANDPNIYTMYTVLVGNEVAMNYLPHHLSPARLPRGTAPNPAVFCEHKLRGEHRRVELSDHLQKNGWRLVDSSASVAMVKATSGDATELMETVRERWLLPTAMVGK